MCETYRIQYYVNLLICIIENAMRKGHFVPQQFRVVITGGVFQFPGIRKWTFRFPGIPGARE